MIKYFRTRGKGISVYFLFILALFIFLASVLTGCRIFSNWFGLIVGFILTLLAIPCHLLIGKRNALGYFLSYFLNTIGVGFSVSAYYLVKDVHPYPEKLINGIIPAAILMLLIGLLMTFAKENKHIFIVIFAIFEIGLVITSIVFWVKHGGETFAIVFFSLLLSSFYIAVYAVTIDEDERGVLRDCSFGSYGFYLVATVVVIVILLGAMGCDDCSCDGCDCGDCCDCDTGKGGKKKGK